MSPPKHNHSARTAEMTQIRRIAVLMTSFNRKAHTLRALESVKNQRAMDDRCVEVFLVDDGGTDGTGDAVRIQFPDVHLLQGDGSLYWNGGMRKAFAAALSGRFDGYLLLNDDTELYADALARVVRCAEDQIAAGAPAIVVGSTRSPQTGAHSYGGVTLSKHGARVVMKKVAPHESEPVTCDTMNGNIALIPRAIAAIVGNLDIGFRHQFGDLDYGLRARHAGFAVVIAPGYAGECEPNAAARTWRDENMPLARRWKHLMSPKGAPPAEWLLFTRRHYGWTWLHYAFSPYVKTIISSLKAQRSGRGLTNAAAPRQ